MRTAGVEPAPLAGQDPKSCASASSATFACPNYNNFLLPRRLLPAEHPFLLCRHVQAPYLASTNPRTDSRRGLPAPTPDPRSAPAPAFGYSSALRAGLALGRRRCAVDARAQSCSATQDARPALLVAVAVSALYGGLGPGILALALAGLLAPDPVVLVAGAALAAVCATFRRARPAPGLDRPASGAAPVSESPENKFQRFEVSPIGFAPESARSSRSSRSPPRPPGGSITSSRSTSPCRRTSRSSTSTSIRCWLSATMLLPACTASGPRPT